jgi:hypothetical protein
MTDLLADLLFVASGSLAMTIIGIALDRLSLRRTKP